MEKYKLAISTVSLGWHQCYGVEEKIKAAAKYGFAGIEIFYTDLVKYAHDHAMSQLGAARAIRQLCASQAIEIISICSFDQFEGSHRSLKSRLDIARHWSELANELGTHIIQIPSNDDREAKGDGTIIVSELQALSGIGKEHGVSFAYEALAWGTHVADWEEALRIVQLVNRPNFGLCLDTYHVLSRIWADARSLTGRRPGGMATLRSSLDRFLEKCPTEKMFYVQLSDAERMSPPILPGHPAYSETKDATHSWCSYGRLFPLEEERGAYLPVVEIARIWLIDKGWCGWVSMEIFHRDMTLEEYGPSHWASRGQRAWTRLINDVQR